MTVTEARKALKRGSVFQAFSDNVREVVACPGFNMDLHSATFPITDKGSGPDGTFRYAGPKMLHATESSAWAAVEVSSMDMHEECETFGRTDEANEWLERAAFARERQNELARVGGAA